MIRRLLILAGALALAACGGPAPEPERDWPEPSPALWEVSGQNGERAWLFGTIHALPDGMDWRTPAFDRALAASDVIMVELGDLDDSSAAARAFEAVSRQQNLPMLSARVPLEDRPALHAMMREAEMDDADFWDTETWAAALILGNAVRESDSENGVDRALLDDARPIEALETFAGQFTRFDRLSEPQQRAFLVSVVRSAARPDEEARALAWLKGDLAALETLVEGELAGQPVLRQTLLSDRNTYFVARVVQAIEAGRKPLVAVGAGHMLGDEGLPAQLAARGYAVRRVQ